MPTDLYRYSFADSVPVDELEATIVLAIIATESLHGESQARLDLAHRFDAKKRTCAIDARTAAGRDFNRLFVGFASREYGPDSFTVSRVREARPEVEPVTA